MLILGIESSCDETAVAVVEDGRRVLSDEISSQVDIHAVYGGVVPEIASRNHVRAISALADSAVARAGITKGDIDAVAVTYAPGLIGAVLVGVNFAKGAAMALNVPLVPVHHIRGHLAANYIAFPELEPPFLGLIVSGGNTILADVRDYTDIRILGSTRDDAAGECFDKAARVLGLPYPGGAEMDRLASLGDPDAIKFPSAAVAGDNLDFSFSGLKTSVINYLHTCEQKGVGYSREDIAASFTKTVVTSVTKKLDMAIDATGLEKIVIAGGVAANSHLREGIEALCKKRGLEFFTPPKSLCGDNAAMIAAQGYYEYLAGVRADTSLNAYASGRNDI